MICTYKTAAVRTGISDNFCNAEMFLKFVEHIDKHGKCKFVLASESGKFIEERTGGHFPASYPCGMGVGLLLYSSSRYSRTCLLNGLRYHAFFFRFPGTGPARAKELNLI